MKPYRNVLRQMISTKIDKRVNKRQQILLPQNKGVIRIELAYDDDGKLEFMDIIYKCV